MITLANKLKTIQQSKGLIYVGGKTEGFANTSSVVSLTDLTGGIDSAPSAGDFIVVTTGKTLSSTSPSLVTTAGYTALSGGVGSNDNYDTALRSAYKFMGATPDTSVTISGAGGYASVTSIVVFRNVDVATPFDITHTWSSGINSAKPLVVDQLPVTDGAAVVAVGFAGVYVSFTWSQILGTNIGFQQTYFNGGTRQGLGGFCYQIVETAELAGWTQFYYGTVYDASSWTGLGFVLRPVQ